MLMDYRKKNESSVRACYIIRTCVCRIITHLYDELDKFGLIVNKVEITINISRTILKLIYIPFCMVYVMKL